ncbi:hypothetical protein AGMMS49965_03020 [Bacteroidia bacterium]|nr:hypothetical protein AGMMS49965_03020 [Bacteroidia bacterium]
MTNEQSQYLLSLPKRIVENNNLLNTITINQEFPFNKRFELISEKDDEFTFLWEIQQSKKNTIRISLHYQENDSKIGLLRIDYNGGHINPETISDSVPEKFHPYAGKEFSNNEHHIHYHIEGYKSLAWAIPLTDDEFEVKELKEGNDFNNSLANAVRLFAKTINIETEITINTLLL